MPGMADAHLRAEQSRLQAEIAKLHGELRTAERALAKCMETPYPGPRGFGMGVLAGGALAVVFLVGLAGAMFLAYARFMSHMG
jgi:hypothetical protein